MPREGHDCLTEQTSRRLCRFQSTCPARGTTSFWLDSSIRLTDFNPRAPRGARRVQVPNPNMVRGISIHVPREGHDFIIHHLNTPICNFNPRAPRGARLCNTFYTIRTQYISIHVPREGHDCISTSTARALRLFQSTCPARGTTSGHSFFAR